MMRTVSQSEVAGWFEKIGCVVMLFSRGMSTVGFEGEELYSCLEERKCDNQAFTALMRVLADRENGNQG